MSQEGRARGERGHDRPRAGGGTEAGISETSTTPSRSTRRRETCTSIRCTCSRCSTAIARIGMSAADPVAAAEPRRVRGALQLGHTDRYLFLYLEVDDPHFVAEPRRQCSPDRDRFDRVDITLERSEGSLETYFFAIERPGPHSGANPGQRRRWHRANRRRTANSGVLAGGRSRLSSGGAAPLEPRRGSRLWLEAQDGSGKMSGFKVPDPPHGGRLFMATPGLDGMLGRVHPCRYPRHGGRCQWAEARHGRQHSSDGRRWSTTPTRKSTLVSPLRLGGHLVVAADGVRCRSCRRQRASPRRSPDIRRQNGCDPAATRNWC